jgi:hypothetical protein
MVRAVAIGLTVASVRESPSKPPSNELNGA